MALGDLRAYTRTMVDDATEPYLWPDADVDRRLNNAVREACLRARLLRADADTDPRRCLIAVKAGQALVPFPASVLVPRSVSLADGAHTLRLMASTDMDKVEPGWDAGRVQSGRPEYAVMDMAQRVLRLWPTPDADMSLRLRVWRVPDDTEIMEQDGDEPVVVLPDPEELCHWAAYECFMVRDAETFDANAAAEHLQMFTARFGARPTLHDMARWADSPPRVRDAHMF